MTTCFLSGRCFLRLLLLLAVINLAKLTKGEFVLQAEDFAAMRQHVLKDPLANRCQVTRYNSKLEESLHYYHTVLARSHQKQSDSGGPSWMVNGEIASWSEWVSMTADDLFAAKRGIVILIDQCRVHYKLLDQFNDFEKFSYPQVSSLLSRYKSVTLFFFFCCWYFSKSHFHLAYSVEVIEEKVFLLCERCKQCIGENRDRVLIWICVIFYFGN